MISFKKSACLIFITLFISTSYATKYAASEPQKIYSHNKYFYIQTNPGESKYSVMRIRHHKAELLWSFSFHPEMSDDLFITNNGKKAYVVRGKYVKIADLHKPAVLIFTPDGLAAKHSYLQLTTPRKYRSHEVGPIGDFWRIWRGEAFLKHGSLQIDTVKGVRYLQ